MAKIIVDFFSRLMKTRRMPKKFVGYSVIWVALFCLVLINLFFFGYNYSHAASLQQSITDTLTVSPTVSPTFTVSLSPTETATFTPDFTATYTATSTSVTLTPSPSSSPTSTQAPVITFTPSRTLPTQLSGTPESVETYYTATSTYLPLPSVTMIYPKVTATHYLMSAYRHPGSISKQQYPYLITVFARLWPIGLVMLIWGIIVVWFILIQSKLF